MSRPQLDTCLACRRPGDTLLVWRLDRLGRPVSHLVTVIADLAGRGIEFCALSEAMGTTTAAGKIAVHVFAALAGFERDLIRERTVIGLAAVRESGERLGRRSVMAPERIEVASRILAEGLPVSQIANTLGVGRATIYRSVPIRGAGLAGR